MEISLVYGLVYGRNSGTLREWLLILYLKLRQHHTTEWVQKPSQVFNLTVTWSRYSQHKHKWSKTFLTELCANTKRKTNINVINRKYPHSSSELFEYELGPT